MCSRYCCRISRIAIQFLKSTLSIMLVNVRGGAAIVCVNASMFICWFNVQVLMVSMSGSLRSAPEPILDWVFNESDREGRNFHFLDGRPNQKRKIFFKFILTWIATHAMSHGACYALIDPVTNAIVAAAACFPPNDDNVCPRMVAQCESMLLLFDRGLLSFQFLLHCAPRRGLCVFLVCIVLKIISCLTQAKI